MTRKEIKEFGQHVADKLFHKKEQNNSIVIKGWVAKDKCGLLYFYEDKPIKKVLNWDSDAHWTIALNPNYLHQINWEDNEPTPCEIIIKIEK